MKDQLDRVLFLSVPESLRGQIEGAGNFSVENFSIDPAIPIPVEIPDGEETLKLEELSIEMIIAGLLRVIQADRMNQHLNYYRNFVLAMRPGILGEFTEAAILKARNGDFDLALDILNALLGLFPHSPATLLNRALVLEERAGRLLRQEKAEAAGEINAAAAAYEQVLSLEPPFPDAFFNAGFFYAEQKNYSRALECFSRYLEIAADDDDEKNAQALAIKKEIEKSGLADDSFAEACNLIRQNRETQALEHIREFIERRPDVWNGWFILGWALRRLERWADGAAAFQKAVSLGGGDSDTRNELAICLMETGDLAAARRELEIALRHDPENVKIISNLGVLALRNGSDDEAAAFFRTVLELDESDPIALAFFSRG